MSHGALGKQRNLPKATLSPSAGWGATEREVEDGAPPGVCSPLRLAQDAHLEWLTMQVSKVPAQEPTSFPSPSSWLLSHGTLLQMQLGVSGKASLVHHGGLFCNTLEALTKQPHLQECSM